MHLPRRWERPHRWAAPSRFQTLSQAPKVDCTYSRVYAITLGVVALFGFQARPRCVMMNSISQLSFVGSVSGFGDL